MTIIEALQAAKESPGKVGARRLYWARGLTIIARSNPLNGKWFRLRFEDGEVTDCHPLTPDEAFSDDWETVEVT